MAATKAEIYGHVLKPLLAGYTPRHNPDREPEKHGEMIDLLVSAIVENKYSVNALSYGMKVFQQEWAYARWPVFGELKPFLAIGERRAGDAAPKVESKKPNPQRWADHIMRTPNGQTAIESGHALSLYEWAEENPNRTPTSEDMAEVIETTRRQQRNLEALRKSTNAIDQRLLKIGEGMEKKRVRVEVYYGRVAA